METAISLGSNLGDRLATLQKARDEIAGLPRTRLLAASPVYETEPVGVKPEYRHLLFLNAVVIYETELALPDWFSHLRLIEQRVGRMREADRYAPRTIDIDLLYYGWEKCSEGDLVLPHQHWNSRRFVVQPLADLRPHLVLPDDPRPVRDILAALPPQPAVKLLTALW